ncbi:hypothetical protein C8Q74DRAFT_1259416, partial [Fomes fomentarius]
MQANVKLVYKLERAQLHIRKKEYGCGISTTRGQDENGDAPNELARESHAQGRRAVGSVIEGM